MDNGKIPITIYLDLTKAFDILDHFILLEKFKHYDIVIKLFLFLKATSHIVNNM